MKKMLLILVSGLLLICMAGSAMAGTSTATVLLPNEITINPDGNAVSSVSVSIQAQDSSASYPQTYTVEVQPTQGIEAYIGDSTDINVGSSSSWATYTSFLSNSFQTTASNQQHTGKLYVRGTEGGTVKVKVYQGGSVIADKLISVESLGVNVPEFPTVAAPIAGIIGLLFVFGRRKEGL